MSTFVVEMHDQSRWLPVAAVGDPGSFLRRCPGPARWRVRPVATLAPTPPPADATGGVIDNYFATIGPYPAAPAEVE